MPDFDKLTSESEIRGSNLVNEHVIFQGSNTCPCSAIRHDFNPDAVRTK